MNPMAVYALESIDAETLCLVPHGPLNNITASSKELQNQLSTGNWIEVEGEKMQLYISKPNAPSSTPKQFPCTGNAINPYFWVSTGGDLASANMMVKQAEHKGYKFSVLVNFKEIAPYQRLFLFEPSQLLAKKMRTA